MALRTLVKASSINNLSDARYCAGMGVDLIGFNLKSEALDSFSSKTFKEILSWVSGVTIVGEFGGEEPGLIKSRIEEYPVEMIEVNQPGILPSVNQIGPPVILRTYIEDLQNGWKHLKPLKDQMAYLVLDSKTNHPFSTIQTLVKDLSRHFSLLFGAGIVTDNILSILECCELAGIDLHGGSEIRPGYKTYDELADILEILEVDD